MPRRRFAVEPPVWSSAELEAQRALARASFVEERLNEGPRLFESIYEDVAVDVWRALEQTGDLLDLRAELFVGDRHLFQVLRNFCAPPVSEEDLWSMVGHKFATVPAGLEEETASFISTVIDRIRFPWVLENRPPTDEERTRAVVSTATYVAINKHKTARRGLSSRRQEEAVTEALERAGLKYQNVAKIEYMEHLPPGYYCREKTIKGAKCDVPARLHDGRLLALECKVSNGPKNSWKRVNHEAGDKSQIWARGFGEDVVTGVVLAGNFDRACLEQAQSNSKLTIFWEHDLARLTDFVAAAVPLK